MKKKFRYNRNKYSRWFFMMSLMPFLIGLLYFFFVDLDTASAEIDQVFSMFLMINGAWLALVSTSVHRKRGNYFFYTLSGIVDVLMGIYLYSELPYLKKYLTLFLVIWLLTRVVQLVICSTDLRHYRSKRVKELLGIVTVNVGLVSYFLAIDSTYFEHYLIVMVFFGIINMIHKMLFDMYNESKVQWKNRMYQYKHKSSSSKSLSDLL